MWWFCGLFRSRAMWSLPFRSLRAGGRIWGWVRWIGTGRFIAAKRVLPCPGGSGAAMVSEFSLYLFAGATVIQPIPLQHVRGVAHGRFLGKGQTGDVGGPETVGIADNSLPGLHRHERTRRESGEFLGEQLGVFVLWR